MTESRPGSFDQINDELSESASEEEVRRENFSLREQLIKSRKDKDSATKLAKELKDETEELLTELSLYRSNYSSRPRWMTSRIKEKNHGTLLTFLSDAHYSEMVNPNEISIQGYNKYDMRIAQLRTQRFFEKTIHLSRNFLAGVKYDGIVLALGGDLVSGEIHQELLETNELSTYETVETVVPWLARGIEMLLEEFGRVHVVSAPGNHGRNTKKPRHKRRSQNNADTHIAKLLARELVSIKKTPGVSFDIPEASDVDFQIYNTRFTMEHGDDLKFNGTSEIGSLGPVKRGTLRTSTQRQVLGRPFDVFLVGHFHQFVPAYTQGFIMNGSLKGYDEYAHRGKFRPEPAQQSLAVVTPEHGITMVAPIIVTDRKREKW